MFGLWWPKAGTVVVKKGGGVGRKMEEHCLGLKNGLVAKNRHGVEEG